MCVPIKSVPIVEVPIPNKIPSGSRIVVRTCKVKKTSENTNHGKFEYFDVIGHVIDFDGITLHIMRDPAANGSRAAQEMYINASDIVRWKPIPERRFQKPIK